MSKYTLEQYQRMAKKFNELTFKGKLEVLIANKDIITLAADHNWWGVKAKDKEIQEQLLDTETGFNIENEWQANEIMVLVDLLGLEITDI